MVKRIIYLILVILLSGNSAEASPIIDGDQAKYISEVLRVHNDYRKSVNKDLPDLKWNQKLADFAQKVAGTCQVKHSPKQWRYNLAGFGYVGENLAFKGSSFLNKSQLLRLPITKEGLKNWFDEKVDYDYASNMCTPGKQCGHYTQMIWQTSTSIGCAVESCPGMFGYQYGWMLACNYGPGGNYEGQRPYIINPNSGNHGGNNGNQKPKRRPCRPGYYRKGGRCFKNLFWTQ